MFGGVCGAHVKFTEFGREKVEQSAHHHQKLCAGEFIIAVGPGLNVEGVGRYLLRRMVVGWMSRQFPKWQAVDGAISKEGWKLITLLRLSPIIPWNLLNYALAVTGGFLAPR